MVGSSRVLTLFVGLVLIVGCAPGTTAPSAQSSQTSANAPKALTIGITNTVTAFGNLAESTRSGGWTSVSEVHSNALVTSDERVHRPIPRLAEEVPSFDDGTLSLLPDGRLRVAYPLRHDVLWQDGVPLTAEDMAFSVQFNADRGLPNPEVTAVALMESAEAPDPYTFVVYFKEPFYLANTLGIRLFWPQPKHLLGDAYDRYRASGNADEVINLPYWTSQYLHTGPFRLTAFDPAGDLVFEAFDQYFLGRPKLDAVRVRVFLDDKVLFSSLLTGTVDLVMEGTLSADLGLELKARWESSGEGTVPLKDTGQRLIASQWRPAYQMEPANFDLRVRQALYMALDRKTISEGLQSGHGERAASELLTPGSVFYADTKGAFDRYAYNPDRALSLLREAGWAPAADGFLHNSCDGRPFKNSISSTAGKGEREIGAYADYWRKLGIDTAERVVPLAFERDRAYRAQYPGWEASSAGGGDGGDGILHKLEGPAATADNRWTGNRDGFEDPLMQGLLRRYWTSLRELDRQQTLREITDYAVEYLPILVLFTNINEIGTRARVKALDDYQGGEGGGAPYGTFTRNAHLWDVA